MKFNKKLLLRICGITLLSMGLLVLPCIFYALLLDEWNEARGFSFTFFITALTGFALVKLFKPSTSVLKIRDGYLAIALSALLGIITGVLLYYISSPDVSFASAVFESTAGLSTTSATVIGEVSMAKSLLFWKTLEHWVGGIGILLFLVAILPLLGSGEQQLATAEAQGTTLNKIAPRYKNIIHYLIKIYTALTVIAFVYFLCCNISSYDALILSLCCTSTSGVFLHTGGLSHYNNVFVEMGVSLFCIMGGTSFVLYVHLIKKHFSEVKRNVEIKVYLGIISLATIIVFIQLVFVQDRPVLQAVKTAFLQTGNFATTSGFAIEDYTLWSSTSIITLFILLIIGGCSSSTTGALKVIRTIISFKLIERGIFKRIHPRAVRAVKVGNSVISAPMVSSVTTFIILFFFTFIISALVLSLQNLDMETTISAVLGTMSNNGISFGQIGMDGDYHYFNDPLKLYLALLMVVGRLGIINIVILFTSSFWSTSRKSFIQ